MSERLAREIINNTAFSAGDKFGSIVDVNRVFQQAGREAGEYANQLYRSGRPIPDPGEDGGGGGSPPPSEDPTPDRSDLNASLESLDSPQPGVVSVRWSVSNTIVSGDGQTVGGTAEITVDGQTVETAVVNVPPGGEQGGRVGLADVTPGTREVCVRLQ